MGARRSEVPGLIDFRNWCKGSLNNRETAKQHWRRGSDYYWRSQRIQFSIPPTSFEGFQRMLGEMTGELGEDDYKVSSNLCILRK